MSIDPDWTQTITSTELENMTLDKLDEDTH